MIPCVAIFGPTASGKSSLAIEVAKHFGGAIISADSMQIYRRFDIGTAKPTKEEMLLVPHRMIDVCEPDTLFSVYDYQRMAKQAIYDVVSSNMLPILTGGTGLYFDAMFYNTDFGEFETNPRIREKLSDRYEEIGGQALLDELSAIDPEAASSLHAKDKKRIIRALEVFYSTGSTLSSFRKSSHKTPSDISFIKIHLVYRDRQVLYDRINKRVDEMLANGLIEETDYLLQSGYLSDHTSSQAIGYKELLPYFQKSASLEECIARLKQKTRNYAKRQITWFRRYDDALTVEMDTCPDPLGEVIGHLEPVVEKRGNR